MGFWQNLADSYEKNKDVLSKIYPLSTTSISNNGDMIVIIVINGKGKFIRADKIEKAAPKKGIDTKFVTIPASEESLKRTSTAILPYPVFDKYEYLKEGNAKNEAYIEQLKYFAESSFATEEVKAIYKYIVKRTVASDLSEMKPKDTTYVVFQVEIPEQPQHKSWEDETLFNAWHQYYLAKIGNNTKSLDFISGEVQPIASFHPKKISNASANSKLISDNDKTNYTFRGKFEESSQAVSIGYETSQKAHQFLRYLVNNRGYYCGEQVILSFSVGTTKEVLPPPLDNECIWTLFHETQSKTENDNTINFRAETGIDYAEALRKSLDGYKHKEVLKQHAKTAVVALDAATKGRLSITFYRELNQTEYLEKIADWHAGCKWNQQFWNNENKIFVQYTGAPSVDKIIEAVHGKPRGGNDESYTKIKKASRERLLRCIFDGAFLPKDYVMSSVRRASNPLGITKNSKFDRSGFEQIVSTACALVRKDYKQHKKEDFKLSIELNRTDRDYLYGRLLGAADKLEEYALRKQENDRLVTAAIRHMQAFAQRPFRTWQTIHSCLNPYIQKVKGSFAFNEIQEVYQLFKDGDYGKHKDTPLDGSYLIGYYHERAYIDNLAKNAIDKKKSNNDSKKENGNGQQ